MVTIATTERAGDRDWFDLDIEVKVGDDSVPIADVIRALARGDDYMVLPGGVYFPLDADAFSRLRDLLAEARELGDGGSGGQLRISRFQGSLWEELAALGIVQRQADTWRTRGRRPRRQRRGHAAAAGAAAALPGGAAAVPADRATTGSRFLYDSALGGVLADDMGLGKTVQSLALVARAVSSQAAPGGAEGGPGSSSSPRPASCRTGRRRRPASCPTLKVVAIGETTRRSGRTPHRDGRRRRSRRHLLRALPARRARRTRTSAGPGCCSTRRSS